MYAMLTQLDDWLITRTSGSLLALESALIAIGFALLYRVVMVPGFSVLVLAIYPVGFLIGRIIRALYAIADASEEANPR